MRKFFRRPIRFRVGKKHLHFGTPVQIIFWGIVMIFVVGAYYSFGPSGARARSGSSSSTPAAGQHLSTVVAKIGKDSISREDYDKQLAMLGLEEGPLSGQWQRKLQTLESMVDEKLQLEAVKTEKVTVGNDEIEAKRQQLLDQAVAQRFPNKRDLKEYLDRKKLTFEQYKQQLADERFGDTEALRSGLEIEKLRNTVQGRVQVSDQELKDSFTEYHALHILIMPDKEKTRAEDAAKAAKSTVPATFDADAAARQSNQGRRLRGSGQGQLRRSRQRGQGRRPGLVQDGPDGAGIRRRGAGAQTRAGLRHRQEPVRLPHHQAPGDALDAAQGLR
jgi:hypothetical protein